MASLIATPATAGLSLPLTLGGASLAAFDPGPAVSVAPFRGRADAVAALLGPLPPPGPVVAAGAGRLLWTGDGRWLLLGAAAPEGLAGIAAVTEQGDGMAGVRLEGPGAGDALARLVPLDLAGTAFPVGTAARTLLGHMTVTLIRPEPQAWEILAFRSMAGTLAHDLAEAMRGVAARARLPA